MNQHIQLIDLQKQYGVIQDEIDPALSEMLRDASFIGGPAVDRFENDFSSYIGGGEVISCGNGTDSMEILLTSMGVGPGDEVIIPAMTWISTSEVVATRGAKPVFVDVRDDDACLDVDLVERAITKNTKAIIPVHLYGNCVDMAGLNTLSRKHNLNIIEDCAQAHGSSINGRKMGDWGDAGSYSFFPSKNLGCYGDGGAIYTSNNELAQECRLIARHGQRSKNTHLVNGRNSRLDAIQAKVLSIKLAHLDNWIRAKNKHADYYMQELSNIPGLKLPRADRDGERRSWHLFTIRTDRRDDLQEFLQAKGISTGIHYPVAPPLQACYKEFNHTPSDFPVAVNIQNETLSIPMYAELEENELAHIVKSIKAFFK